MSEFLHCLICGAQEGPTSIVYDPLIDGWVCDARAVKDECADKAREIVAAYGRFELKRQTQHLIYRKQHK